ncbi:MAG: hypothetical protein OXF44_08625 [Anaerolineaceae bacterium]|nr:hypothetical protein [Anaerolineaceae bacterium]
MNIRFSPFYAALLALLAIVAALLLYVEQRGILSRRNEETRSNYVNYVLADGLRQTSDDLTRMVRLYAVTGDPLYKDYFDQILAIRNGEQARPARYFQIPYWDLVLATGEHQGEAGETVPIRELITGSDASRLEVTLLADAEDWSNVLVELENEVMDVVAAQIEAGDGTYRLEGEALAAMQRLHGQEYHVAKERIMRPLVLLSEFATDEEGARDIVGSVREMNSVVLGLVVLGVLIGLVAVAHARGTGQSLRRGAPLVTLLAIVSMLVFTALTLRTQDNVDLLADTFGERYRSYTLSDGLRQTSDDLTRMVRLYAATGDPVYRDYFDEILAIRNGESPRPERYFEVPYWDIVLATGRHPGDFGDSIPIRTLISERDFTGGELDLLAEAEGASNELVVLENRAMEVVAAAIAGGGDYDLSGPPGIALQRLHGEDYHKAKARIMLPLVNLARSVQQRLADARQEALATGQQNSVFFGAAMGLSILFSLAAVVLWRREGR